MGFFSDITDAVKKRISDPPKFKIVKHDCTYCKKTGVCPVCNGEPGHKFKIIGAVLLILDIFLMFLLDKIIFAFPFIVIPVSLYFLFKSECECQKTTEENNSGKCRICNGKGYTTEQVRVGGTDILEAIQNTRQSSSLVKKTLTSGNMSIVEMEIKTALDLNPSNFAANAIMGALFYDKGDLDQAIKYLLLAEKRKPKNIEIKQFLLMIYEEQGNYSLVEKKKIELINIGIKSIEKKQFAKNLAAGAVGGIVAGFIGAFIPFIDE